MYFQIVNFCNMTCSHCGMACKKTGETMSIETFRNALQYSDEMVTIGGGEPTLHPFFWQILGESIAHAYSVWLATNGSNTGISLALAKMAQKGVLGVALSQDRFHDPIDPRVIQAFTVQGIRKDDDQREIRNVEKNLVKSGRCKTGKKGCICEDLFCKPNGDVSICGCLNAPVFDNINEENFAIPNDYEFGTCYNDQKNRK